MDRSRSLAMEGYDGGVKEVDDKFGHKELNDRISSAHESEIEVEGNRSDEEERDVEASRVGEVKKEEEPNGGYGWVCVVCIFMINAHTWGLNSSYGVFLAHYLRTSLFPGSSRLSFAFVGGLSISQALLVSPLATMTTRLYGTRTTLLIGVFLQTLSLIGASFATRMSHLFLSQGVCFGWGMGFLFVGSVVIVPQWFTTRRSLANGIAASGSGLGGLIYSLAAQSMIQKIELAWTFRVLAILSCVVNLVCAVLVKDRNKAIGSSMLSFDYRLFKRLEFLGLLAFGFLSMLGYIVLLFSLPAYAASVGMTAKQGSIIGAVLNLGQALGRPPIGYFSDAVGRINMTGVMTFLAGLFSLVIWVFADGFGVLVFFALVVGMVAGTYWAVVGPVSTEVMGLRDLPAALSITWVVLVLPTTFSEAIALEIVDFNGGSYRGAQLFAGFMYVGAAAFVWLVRAWKIGEMEEKAMELGISEEKLDPVATTETETVVPGNGEGEEGEQRKSGVKSGFVKRLFKWQRV